MALSCQYCSDNSKSENILEKHAKICKEDCNCALCWTTKVIALQDEEDRQLDEQARKMFEERQNKKKVDPLKNNTKSPAKTFSFLKCLQALFQIFL
jgi:hypothetical protein